MGVVVAPLGRLGVELVQYMRAEGKMGREPAWSLAEKVVGVVEVEVGEGVVVVVVVEEEGVVVVV